MSKEIKIVEVGPRDGFQSISTSCGIIPTEIKVKYIDKLVDAGLKSIQYSSFVSPKAIPQLADAKALTEIVLKKYPNVDLYTLVPNLRGAKDAVALGVKKVAYVVSFSETHNKANINRTHQQSLDAYKEIKCECPDLNIDVNFATALGCPFEGKYYEPEEFLEFMQTYVDEGIQSATIADTIGIADPRQVKKFITAIKKEFPNLELGVHFHDTRGLGMANSLTALEAGVNKIEAALGGLGGCPFAPGASGNLATEDLVYALTEMSYETGINFEKLVLAAKEEKEDIKGNYSGHHINIEKISEIRKL